MLREVSLLNPLNESDEIRAFQGLILDGTREWHIHDVRQEAVRNRVDLGCSPAHQERLVPEEIGNRAKVCAADGVDLVLRV